MRRFTVAGAFACQLVRALLTVGLRARGGDVAEVPSGEKKAANAPKPVEYFHVDPATAGTITGAITFTGAKPARELISMESDEGCQKAHAGKPAYDEAVVTGKNGGLANAFVYIQAGLEGKKFEPNDRSRGAGSARLHVRAAHHRHPRRTNPRPQERRRRLAQRPSHAGQQSRMEPGTGAAGPDRGTPLRPAGNHDPVKCNIHAWMHSYIGVVDHPYFAVTGPDGAFEWKNVPPGDYTIVVWHEKLGKQEQQVHVAPAAPRL